MAIQTKQAAENAGQAEIAMEKAGEIVSMGVEAMQRMNGFSEWPQTDVIFCIW
jgi:hypothetical protein